MINLFEYHITVTGLSDVEFAAQCEFASVRPVFIERDSGSSLPRQMMTKKFHRGTYESALSEMLEKCKAFSGNILRRKLELILGKAKPPRSYKYLEFHAKFAKTDSLDFRRIAEECLCKTSDGTISSFVTARDEGSILRAISRLSAFQYSGMIRECVLFDDNESIDDKWRCECPIKII